MHDLFVAEIYMYLHCNQGLSICCRYYGSAFTRFNTASSRKKPCSAALWAFKVVQSLSGSSKLVPIESPYAISY